MFASASQSKQEQNYIKSKNLDFRGLVISDNFEQSKTWNLELKYDSEFTYSLSQNIIFLPFQKTSQAEISF